MSEDEARHYVVLLSRAMMKKGDDLRSAKMLEVLREINNG